MQKWFFLILFALAAHLCPAQGCVAIRSNGATCTMAGMQHDETHTPAPWVFGANSRYFKSYRHFVGTEEQKDRVKNGTEVINHSFSTEFNLLHILNPRWSVALYVPLIHNTRSSMYEHYGNNSKSPYARRETKTFGLGDVRLSAYYWLTSPAGNPRFNLQVGAGLKLPTGDYRYPDYFWKNDSTKVLGPVDQSIQLGDGGTGLTTEYNLFFHMHRHLGIYSNGYYLLNPREQNGVSTARGGTASSTSVLYGSDVMSVPDQFMFRGGATVTVRRFQLSGGLRIEGVPAKDLIGGSNGFRRPGYVISAEPVVLYNAGKSQLYLSVPVALVRNRTQSVPDKVRTKLTGVYAHGDAAFADYTLNLGVSLPLGK